MDAALHEHVGDLARWRRPGGGYFFWLELPPDRDATRLKARAAEFNTGFMAGELFSVSGRFRHCLRLPVSNPETV